MDFRGIQWGVAAVLLTASFVNAVQVQRVRIESLSPLPVDEKSIAAYTQIREGREVDGTRELRALLSADVKKLRDSDRFTFVSADIEQFEDGTLGVIYRVKRKPHIREILVTGAERMGSEKVIKELEIKPDDLIDDLLLAGKVRQLKEFYAKHHYPYAEADWDLAEKKDGSVDLLITVTEGVRFLVNRIEFDGNTVLGREELLAAMTQKERVWWKSWVTGAGTYKPESVDADVAAIRSLYQGHGYLDAEVGEPVLDTADGGKGVLTFKVAEGDLYKVGQVTFDDPTVYSREEIQQRIRLHSGDVASMQRIKSVASAVQQHYGNNGYIRASVRPQVTPTETAGIVDVHYRISEGSQAYINRIEIRGNTKTKDKVLRRELAIVPGDRYNQQKIDSSARRLQNLGYFSKVQDVTERVEGDKYDLTFNVEEQSTGQFMVGGGVSSDSGLVGFLEVSQGNFDIDSWPPVGGGQKARLRAQLGSDSQAFNLSFTEPWFRDQRLSLGVNLYHSEASYYSDYFDQTVDGFSTTLSKPISRFDRMSVKYSLENYRITDMDDDASDEMAAEEGSTTKSQLQLSLTHDTRDNYYIPHRGNRTVASVYGAGGPLLGEEQVYGASLSSSHYWPLFKDHVFNIRGAVKVVDGYGGEDVPIYDRLFLGGQNTIRAFDYREVGPVDSNDEPIGGKTSYYTTFEYTVPVWKKVRAAGFYDMGFVSEDAYDMDFGLLNSGYGIGLRFDMPGLPLQLNYAWQLESDEHNDDDGGRFTFQMGYSL